MTLEEFLKANSSDSFCLSCGGQTKDGHPCFYIHAIRVDGDTASFYVKDNTLFPLTPDIETEPKSWSV